MWRSAFIFLTSSRLMTSVFSMTPAGAVAFASHALQDPPPGNPPCACRTKGEHLSLGSLRSMQTPSGPKTAECVTVENGTSWRLGPESCPQASLETSRG